MLYTHLTHYQQNCRLLKTMHQNDDNQPHPWKHPSFLCDIKDKPSTADAVIIWNRKEQFCEEYNR